MTSAPAPTKDEIDAVRTLIATTRPDRAKVLLSRFDQGYEVIEGALRNGAVANPAYKDARSRLAGVYEDVTDEIRLQVYVALRGVDLPDKSMDVLTNITAFHSLEGALRKVEAIEAKHPDVAVAKVVGDMYRTFRPVVAATEAAKALAVKRAPPNPDATPAYAPPPASKPVSRAVWEALTEFAQAARQGLVERGVQHRREIVDRWFEAQNDAVQKGVPIGRGFLKATFGTRAETAAAVLSTTTREAPGSRIRVSMPSWEDTILKEAEDYATEAANAFVGKNLAKLASVVEGKGGLAGIDKVGWDGRLEALEGDLRVRFADGSSFVAHNAMVHSYSAHGTPFVRYPLTFHEVVFPDGSRRGGMSEEEMNDEFVSGRNARVAAKEARAEPEVERSTAPTP